MSVWVNDPKHWAHRAEECRALANAISLKTMRDILLRLAQDYDNLESFALKNHLVPLGHSSVTINHEPNGDRDIGHGPMDTHSRISRTEVRDCISGSVEALGKTYRFEKRGSYIHILRQNTHGSWQALPSKHASPWRDLVERELHKVYISS